MDQHVVTKVSRDVVGVWIERVVAEDTNDRLDVIIVAIGLSFAAVSTM